MRIISRFRDYYDAVMKTGMDREVVYVRENVTHELEREYDLDFLVSSSGSYHSSEILFLGYCGQIFKVMTVKAFDQRFVFHDFEEFKQFMLYHKFGSEWDFGHRRWWPSKYQQFQEYDTSKLVDLFHKFQTPLFTLSYLNKNPRNNSRTRITLGPNLKDLGFHRIKDTYTAYQDIFQYVAGVLNQKENNTVNISDKDKIHKHGFDKHSFRNLPGKKRGKK